MESTLAPPFSMLCINFLLVFTAVSCLVSYLGNIAHFTSQDMLLSCLQLHTNRKAEVAKKLKYIIENYRKATVGINRRQMYAVMPL